MTNHINLIENKKRIITTKARQRTRKSLLERYMKEVRNHKPTKSIKGIKYLGVPLERSEEIMGGINIGKPGDLYPMGETSWTNSIEEGLDIRAEGVATWADESKEGIFIKEGYGVKAWSVIGLYGGIITLGEGEYVLEVETKDGDTFRIDAKMGNGNISKFGKMNEDIHGGEVNAFLEDMGLILVIKDVVGPCELLTTYGNEYDWDGLKWGAFKGLKEELANEEGWDGELVKCGCLKRAS